MSIPDFVRIGFCDFSIEPLVEPKKVLGDIEPDHARIRIDIDRPAPMVATTLLHEVLHGAWYMAGMPEKTDEEHAVTVLANQLAQVWRDNPELVAYLSEALGPRL